MLLRFWGVRGSIPTPSPANLKYGGNTSCVEVRTSTGQLIILDAGSGIRPLGSSLSGDDGSPEHPILIFMSHYHWDHIQGFPFFEPLYSKEKSVVVHGFSSDRTSVGQTFGDQFANPYFPVDMSVLRAKIRFDTVGVETREVGGVRITTSYLNHPQGSLAYRIEDGDRVVVYASDHEHGKEPFDRNLRDLAKNADVLIYDCQYTPEEYPNKVGWGHSTWQEGVRVATDAQVKELVMFHHDPAHSDFFVDSMVQAAREQFPNIHGAMEGMEVNLKEYSPEVAYKFGLDKRYNLRHHVPLPLSVRLRDTVSKQERTIVENLSLDGAFFLTEDPLPTGTHVEVEIELAPADNQSPSSSRIKATAKVVRCEKIGGKAGIGITFR